VRAITPARASPMNNPNPSARHPRGLYVLFFTEMWERFGYYLLAGILPLFLRDTMKGGKGMDNASAADIAGTYVALVYLTPFIGGLIADRYLGYRKSIILGGCMMAGGYFLLAIPGSNALMYAALGTVIVGNGFFKPNISTLLGNVYNTEDLRPKKDAAYNIFYMGINIGAFACNFVAAYLRNHYGWGWAFAAAGVGMTLGIIWFLAGMRHIKHADVMKPVQPEDMPFLAIILSVFVPAIVAGVIGWFLGPMMFGRWLTETPSTYAFVFACIPISFFYISVYRRAKGFDRKRVGTLLIIFVVSILFWNIYNQNITALTFWADNYTHREIPASIEPVLKPWDLAQNVDLTPQEVPVLDDHFRTQLGPDGKVITHKGVDPYFHNLPKDQWPKEGKSLSLFSTEIFQSVNPFWIVLLTPFVVGFFGLLRKRGMEPSTPSKMGWGVIISGISSLVMVSACWSTDIYHDKVSAAWITASYGVFTISELFLSPIGLSLVSKVAPKRLTALMMGGWFLTTSLGGKIAGVMASKWDNFDSKANFFLIGAVAALVAGALLLVVRKRLADVVDQATESKD
jgi:POT family proton-dependent oligopeptide transporter